jgi:hypothetical protein
MRHEHFQVQRSSHDLLRLPQAQIRESFAKHDSFKAALMQKVDARRHEASSRLSESIRLAVLDVALSGPTGILARNLLAKHATATGLAA